MPRKYNPLKQTERPVLSIFDKLEREEYTQLVIYSLALSNRLLFKSAIHIRKELGLTNQLNSLHVRYLLIVFLTTLNRRVRDIPIPLLEHNDYTKIDSRRLGSLAMLHVTGLCIMRTRPSGIHTLEITDLGKKAIGIVESQINEVIHAFPRSQRAHIQTRRIDKNYMIGDLIVTSDNKRGKKA